MKRGSVIWLVGLPASGKTTVAGALVTALKDRDRAVLWLDSDKLRKGLMPHLGYTDPDREEFYESIGFLCELASDGGILTVVSATASSRTYRRSARRRVERLHEVWIHCSPEILRDRDPKYLYARADRGEIANLPGVGSDFDEPENPLVVVDTGEESPDTAAQKILAALDSA